jgi:hypothetical protein
MLSPKFCVQATVSIQNKNRFGGITGQDKALTFALCLQPIKMGAILICSLRDLSNPNLSASRKIFV